MFLFCDILFNPLEKKYRLLYLNTQFIPCRKHSISVIKTNQFLCYIGQNSLFFPKINAKNINALCGQNVQFLNVKLVG